MQTQVQQIQERCLQAFAKAKELYGLDLSRVQVRFDLRGRAAGQAYMKRGQYGMRFNRDMLTREAFDHVLNNTVPHEVAHIVCFMNPALGKNHNSGWARVCRQLGGTGATRHEEDFVMGKGTTYEYLTNVGHAVRIGDRHHRYIQSGGTLTFRRNKGSINQLCAYSIVGMNGKTLEAPISGKVPAVNIKSGLQQISAYAEREAAARAVARAGQVATPAKTPLAPVVNRVQLPAVTGESKAAISRRIMLSGFKGGHSYETIIAAMIAANGYDRQLARGTFKANAPKVGIPASFYS